MIDIICTQEDLERIAGACAEGREAACAACPMAPLCAGEEREIRITVLAAGQKGEDAKCNI